MIDIKSDLDLSSHGISCYFPDGWAEAHVDLLWHMQESGATVLATRALIGPEDPPIGMKLMEAHCLTQIVTLRK